MLLYAMVARLRNSLFQMSRQLDPAEVFPPVHHLPGRTRTLEHLGPKSGGVGADCHACAHVSADEATYVLLCTLVHACTRNASCAIGSLARSTDSLLAHVLCAFSIAATLCLALWPAWEHRSPQFFSWFVMLLLLLAAAATVAHALIAERHIPPADVTARPISVPAVSSISYEFHTAIERRRGTLIFLRRVLLYMRFVRRLSFGGRVWFGTSTSLAS